MDFSPVPRVLIITLNPLSETSSNKTFASFFEGYPKESIAQLYFHRQIPSSDVCNNYYKISDEDIVNYILRRKKTLGERVYSKNVEERIVPLGVNNFFKKSITARFLKDSILLHVNLDNEGLNDWLDGFKPEVIFFCGGARSHVGKAAVEISRKYDIKILQYITDDYILPYFSSNMMYMIVRFLTRKAFKKVCKESSLILTIGDKMSRVYKDKYGIESKKMMNMIAVDVEKSKIKEVKTNDLNFVYIGGLHSNRWKILALLGKSLERLGKQGLNGNLKIYSQHQPDKKTSERINIENHSKYCGSLDSVGVRRVLEKADIVVHVESFDRKSKRTTLLSVSTKIPEYMASQKCILAIGPKVVASIEYILEENAGFVITSRDSIDIDNQIKNVFTNTDKRDYYIKQALLTVMKNHDIKSKTREFQQDLINFGR